MTSVALSTVLQAELARRAVGRQGFVDGKTAVRLDLAVEGGNGADLGLKGLAALALRNSNQDFLLAKADTSMLTDVRAVLAHFTSAEHRCRALARGGHLVDCTDEELDAWFPWFRDRWSTLAKSIVDIFIETQAVKTLPISWLDETLLCSDYVRCLAARGTGERLDAQWIMDSAERDFVIPSLDAGEFVDSCIEYGCPPLPKTWILASIYDEPYFRALEHGGYLTGQETLDELFELYTCDVYLALRVQGRLDDFSAADIIPYLLRSPNNPFELKLAIMHDLAAEMTFDDIAEHLDESEFAETVIHCCWPRFSEDSQDRMCKTRLGKYLSNEDEVDRVLDACTQACIEDAEFH
jgi:hypothetical protein